MKVIESFGKSDIKNYYSEKNNLGKIEYINQKQSLCNV
jgi:hypothetical protein